MERLANVSTLEVLNDPGDPAGCARLVADGAQVLIPLAGVLDPEVERARLSKRLAQIEAEAEQVNKKLHNDSFVAKAPQDVVQKERSRLAALQEETAALAGQLDELG
jgi:valyl-tRNA synthetase